MVPLWFIVFIHSFNKYLLSACVLGPVLVIRDRVMNKTDMAHVLYEIYSLYSPDKY